MSQCATSSARTAGRFFRAMGRGLLAGWRAVDPAARRTLAELPVLGLTLLARRDVPVAPLPADGHRPVVLIHGLGGHRGQFIPMQLWLRLWGHRRLYVSSWPAGASIDALAQHLRDTIARVLAVNGLEAGAAVDVVAHSMGGLVARVAIEDPATARRVATLVTLGTPHGGTYAARLANTPRIRALRPGSSLFERLSVQVPWSAPLPRLVCFWSQDDLMLLPASTACVRGAESRQMTGFTHLSYLLHPRCFQAIADVLSRRVAPALPSGAGPASAAMRATTLA